MNQRGFTLAEVVISVSLFLVLSGIGVAVLMPAITTAKADAEANRLIGVLQFAREAAITRQRDVEMRIDEAAGAIRLIRLDEDEETLFLEVVFEQQMGLRRFDAMGDTPDEFGGDGAVNFGDVARLLFISDGSLVGEDDVPVNGTIYLAMADQPVTARAITINGTTARPRAYRWSNDSWVAQ